MKYKDYYATLGVDKKAGADEINARFRVTRRDLDGLRHAFEIDDYPVSGRLTGDIVRSEPKDVTSVATGGAEPTTTAIAAEGKHRAAPE